MTIYSEYDPFARVYNKHWGDDFTTRVFPIVEQLVLRQLPAGASILDLCCGTGQMARTLTALGYRVTGLDGSAEMLRFARENAPGAEFIHADARSFELPKTFNAVISLFDSLNHLMTLEELTAVFRNVNAVLHDNGSFFFDLNMEAGYGLTWNDSFSIVEDDQLCIIRTSYIPQEKTARFDATVMNLEDGWQRTDFALLQKCYPASEVLSSLGTTGFGGIESYCLDHRKGLIGLTEEADRAFFLCRKPAVDSTD
jgi:predicted TPR repeat methyltransferase